MPIRAFTLILIALTALSAAKSAAAKPAFSPMDVFALEWASDPEISPDGTQVAYVRQSFDIKTDSRRRMIWLVDREGDNHRPLAGGAGNQSSPRWSPDGARLAFVAADGDGAQIHMHWFAQGVTARVTNLVEAPTRLAWSPDGRQLAFVMRVSAKREPLKVKLPEAPKDAKWAEPLKAIDRMVYRVGRRRLPAGCVRPGIRGACRRRNCAPVDRRVLGPRRPGMDRRWRGAPGLRQPARECGLRCRTTAISTRSTSRPARSVR